MLIRQMRVTRNHSKSLVACKAPYFLRAGPAHGKIRGEGVPEVVKSEIPYPCLPHRRAPGLLKVCHAVPGVWVRYYVFRPDVPGKVL